MNIVYLHGFGSSVRSAKAAAIHGGLGSAVRRYDVPELDGGDFPGLTMTAMADRAEAAVRAARMAAGPVLVIGSSLGGYLAALLAAAGRLGPDLLGLVLIAPAFRFPSRWRERLGEAGIAAWRRDGSRLFHHYGAERDLPLGVAFLDSCQDLPDLPGDPGVWVSLIHGRGDESVAWTDSLAYAQAHAQVEFHLVDGGHALDSDHDMRLILEMVRWRWDSSDIRGPTSDVAKPA